MGRVLGVDLGRARVGLALSDPERITAQPYRVLELTNDPFAEAVAEQALTLDVEEIVVGIPMRMDGTKGPEADAAEAFARALGERTGLPVVCWDERLSTKEAERAMRSAGTRARKQRGVVDKIAATLVLQSYLESRR